MSLGIRGQSLGDLYYYCILHPFPVIEGNVNLTGTKRCHNKPWCQLSRKRRSSRWVHKASMYLCWIYWNNIHSGRFKCPSTYIHTDHTHTHTEYMHIYISALHVYLECKLQVGRTPPYFELGRGRNCTHVVDEKTEVHYQCMILFQDARQASSRT